MEPGGHSLNRSLTFVGACLAECLVGDASSWLTTKAPGEFGSCDGAGVRH